ncbi:RES domain-containing protein [Deinococcus aerius]|uniref:RES domain-containing protein n=2 Tax=Deinococcus TaxID=1298 RepID=A0A2I9DIR7_9DEIO|nr:MULTISPECIES: RES family NAD+ phosphorylase [Deinococcus]MBB5293888.1 RES domain-containing protein [Deinococcus metallilatus]QBY07166.1 RES domain-containing protein [Deinococcus metallilatus]RXJ14638.1 RES domain-containing protein [Deinococcus metallilatus]TLK30758.1 RES domain-containing protein [Deinococcus metallilatus]GBF04651.1 RES domain-containing protein [Deinococcus aerius]
MRRGQDLKRALLDAPLWTPTRVIDAYRTVPLLALRKYSPDPLNTAGSVVTGGRYNAPQGFPEAHEMLYLAENTAVAHAEARVITVVTGPPGVVIQPGTDQRPRLDITVKLRLGAVLDLTDLGVQTHLDVQPGDLFQEWLPLNLDGHLALTQLLARAVLDSARYDAILYPSARYPGGRNYAVFPQRVAPTDRAVHDPDGELGVFRRPG